MIPSRLFWVALIAATFAACTAGVERPEPAPAAQPPEPAPQEVKLAAEPELSIIEVNPSIFFVKDKETGAVLQGADVVIENKTGAADVVIEAKVGSAVRSTPYGVVEKGKRTSRVYIPEAVEPTDAEFRLKVNGKVLASRTVEWKPQRKWEVCFIPIAHHDLGYTHTIEEVMRLYAKFYDDVLRFCEETDGWSDESKYRYTVEGTWSLQYYLRNRPKEVHQKLSKYLKEGRIEVSALYGNEISDLCGHEQLVRLMYPSANIVRELGGEIKTGCIVDIPGITWGIPKILANADVKYFFAGLPTYFEWGRNDIHTFWDEKKILRYGRPDAFWWEAQDGKKVLTYYQGTYGFFNIAKTAAGPHSYPEVMEVLPRELLQMQKQGVPFRVMRYIHNGVDNYPPSIEISRIVREWNQRWAYPRLIVSTQTMFFEMLEKEAENLRTFRGEIPNTDYVVGALCTPKTTTINRVTHDRLRAAEIFATIATEAGGRAYPAEEISRAYDDMLLYDEHTWGKAYPAGEIQDWALNEKVHYAYKAAGLTAPILAESIKSIARNVAFRQEAPHIVVFNPLSHERTDMVTLERFNRKWDFELVDDETGKPVPYQIVKLDDPLAPVPYSAHRYGRGQFSSHELYDLVFKAENVPSVGLKTYRLERRDKPPAHAGTIQVGDNTLENRFYRITLDPETGAISGILDKESGRELVDGDAEHGVNQFVVRNVKTDKLLPAEKGSIRKGKQGPLCGSLVVNTRGSGAPQVVQEITLYEDVKRIDLANRILKDSTPMVELYFAFPFKMDDPQFRYEGSNTVVEPTVDQFPGSNTFYYTVQHWADVSDGKMGITLSPYEAHLLEFGGLWPNYCSQAHHGFTPPGFGREFHEPGAFKKGHMYSFVVASNFRTNFQTVQEGDLLYRYSITTHPGDWKEGTPRAFGWATSNPLLPVLVDGKPRSGIDRTTSFLSIKPANVQLVTLKVAEDGDGWIVRLMETDGNDASATVTFPKAGIAEAVETNLLEQNKGKLAVDGGSVRAPVRAHGLTTLRVRPK